RSGARRRAACWRGLEVRRELRPRLPAAGAAQGLSGRGTRPDGPSGSRAPGAIRGRRGRPHGAGAARARWPAPASRMAGATDWRGVMSIETFIFGYVILGLLVLPVAARLAGGGEP